MAAKISVEDLTADREINKFINEIEKDALAALKVASRNLSYSGMSLYPSATVRAYRGDVARLEGAMNSFGDAWNKIVVLVMRKKKVKSLSPLVKACMNYSTALTILETNNSRHSALVDANTAMFVADMSNYAAVVMKNAKKAIPRLEREIKELIILMRRAKTEIKEAKVQRVLNGLISASVLVVTTLVPMGRVVKYGVAVGSGLVHMGVDAALGPSKGSVEGTLNTTVGEIFGVLPKLSGSMQTLASGISDLVTADMDGDEVAEAKAILNEIEKKARVTIKTYKWARKVIHNDQVKFEKLAKISSAAIKKAKSKMKASANNEAKRKKLVGIFKGVNLAK